MHHQQRCEDLGNQIKALTNTAAWELVVWRIDEYANSLQLKVNNHLRNGEYNKAHALLEHITGAKEALRVTERLGEELLKGKLDVDGALTVIENNKRRK